MIIKKYFTLPRALEQEPYHQMQFNVIPRTPLGGGLIPLGEDVISIVHTLLIDE